MMRKSPAQVHVINWLLLAAATPRAEWPSDFGAWITTGTQSSRELRNIQKSLREAVYSLSIGMRAIMRLTDNSRTLAMGGGAPKDPAFRVFTWDGENAIFNSRTATLYMKNKQAPMVYKNIDLPMTSQEWLGLYDKLPESERQLFIFFMGMCLFLACWALVHMAYLITKKMLKERVRRVAVSPNNGSPATQSATNSRQPTPTTTYTHMPLYTIVVQPFEDEPTLSLAIPAHNDEPALAGAIGANSVTFNIN